MSPSKKLKKPKAKTTIQKVVITAPKRAKKKQKQKPKIEDNSGIAASYAGTFRVKPFTQVSDTKSGCDYLTTISLPSNLPDSSIMYEVDLNPLMIPQARRLAQYAALWDKFKWLALKIHYVPSCGTGTDGAITIAADSDPMDKYSGLQGDELLSKMNAQPHNVNPSVIRPATLTIKDRKFFDRVLFMEPDSGSDPRNYTAGKLLIANDGLLTAGTYGRLFLEWKIRFEQPNIEPSIEAGPGIAYAVAATGTFVSAVYPWGDYTAIRNNGNTSQTAYKANQLVNMYSSAILGSVIQFKQTGYYLIAISRTGAAMGTGAFTGAVFNGCASLWTAPPEYTTGVNQATANSGSTASTWIACIRVSEANATISSTGDSGVTHNTASTFVMADNTPYPESQDLVMGQVIEALRKLGLADLAHTVKSGPRIESDVDSGYTGTIAQGQGPEQTISVSGNATLNVGTSALNPLYVEAVVPGADRTPNPPRRTDHLRPSPRSFPYGEIPR